jgi:hypothetical protein
MTQRQRIYYEPNTARKVGTCGLCGLDIFAFPGQLVRTGSHKKCLQKAGLTEKRLAKMHAEAVAQGKTT